MKPLIFLMSSNKDVILNRTVCLSVCLSIYVSLSVYSVSLSYIRDDINDDVSRTRFVDLKAGSRSHIVLFKYI